VPKPHTPFQWRAQDTPDELERKQRVLLTSLRDRAVRVKFHDARVTHVEGVLARGGRSVAPAIEWCRRMGGRFDAWEGHMDYGRWMRAFERAEVRPLDVANRARGYHEPLPWDHIACGVSRRFLRAEDQRAESGIRTEDCRVGRCSGCHACDRGLVSSGVERGTSEPQEVATDGCLR
jgi:hypothetical protein